MATRRLEWRRVGPALIRFRAHVSDAESYEVVHSTAPGHPRGSWQAHRFVAGRGRFYLGLYRSRVEAQAAAERVAARSTATDLL